MIWPWTSSLPLTVDMHSHLIPGIDDGAKSVADSIRMISMMKEAGFQKFITTPHIHPKYPNSESHIEKEFKTLKERLSEKGVSAELEVAAEYFADHEFIEKVDADVPLLTFGERYILIECSFTVKPFFFESLIYKLQERNYQLFLHPERYHFLEGDIGWLAELKQIGVLFQVTLGSIGGYYGATFRKMALNLLKSDMVDFLASDLHKESQIAYLKKGLGHKAVQKLLSSKRLLNQSLL